MSHTSTIALEESVFTGGIVNLRVGRTKCEVYAHKELLRSRSPYFGQLLARPKHGETASIALPDIDADTFCRFLSWLYADSFTIPADDEWMGLCKVWLLAERFQISPLQNKVIEVFSCRLYQRRHTTLDLEILHYVYDNTGPGSPLRMLFVHISMWYGRQDVFAQMLKDMPPVFQSDFAAQHGKRARKLAEEVLIDPWDLTEFLLPEVEVAHEKNVVKIKVEKEQVVVPAVKHESQGEEVRNKTKRAKVETVCNHSRPVDCVQQ